MRDHAKTKVFTLASVALLSCRAVLGIEDIEEGAAEGGAPDAMADSVASDGAAVEASTDAGACSDKVGNECGKCCRDLGGPGYKELEAIIKPCLCDGGCTSSCATNLCAGGDPVQTPCIPCMDTAIKTKQCPKEQNDCFAKPASCKPVYDCIAACK